MLGQKRLLRKIREFIPLGATVIGVDVAVGDGLGISLPTPVVLTDQAVLVGARVRRTLVVTVIPIDHVTWTEWGPGLLSIWFWDTDRGESRTVVLDFREHGERDHFIDKAVTALVTALERRKRLASPAACKPR